MAFIDIPDVPGVPALARGLAAGFVEDVVLLLADAVSLFSGAADPQWGIYQNGAPVVVCDTVVAVGYKEDWNISTYQVEDGAFESYNKVQTPFLIRVKFATGGSVADKQDFLASIAEIIASTALFDVVTPEVTYTSVNVIHQDYDRSAIKGVGLLQVDVVCEQVRVTTASAFTNSTTNAGSNGDGTNTDISIRQPQSSSASPQVNVGTVQPVTPTDSQNASFVSDLQSAPFNF